MLDQLEETFWAWDGSTGNLSVMRSVLESVLEKVACMEDIWLVSVLFDLYSLSFGGGQRGHLNTDARE